MEGLYWIVGIVLWPYISRGVCRMLDSRVGTNSFDVWMSVLLGALLALVWPIALVGSLVAKFVRRGVKNYHGD